MAIGCHCSICRVPSSFSFPPRKMLQLVCLIKQIEDTLVVGLFLCPLELVITKKINLVHCPLFIQFAVHPGALRLIDTPRKASDEIQRKTHCFNIKIRLDVRV